MRLFGLVLVLGLASSSFSAATGNALRADAICVQIRQLLPADLWDLPIASCKARAQSQVIVSAHLTVPAERVLDTQALLIRIYGMKPLRFVCCGYETHVVTVPVPAAHPLKLGTPKGAYRDVGLYFTAPGLADAGRDLLDRGEADAHLVLELIDY